LSFASELLGNQAVIVEVVRLLTFKDCFVESDPNSLPNRDDTGMQTACSLERSQ